MNVIRKIRRGLTAGMVPFIASLVACGLWESRSEPAELSSWDIGESPARGEVCTWEGATHSAANMVLRSIPEFCDLRAVPIAVLRTSVNGAHPDPGDQVLVTAAGRFLSTSWSHLQVLEWDSSGRFLQAVGRTGEGPGEFVRRGGLLLFLGPNDSLFVLDGGNRWTVFDDGLNYQRTFQGTNAGRSTRYVHVGSQGIVTTGDMSSGRTDNSFHLTDFDGALARKFGPRPQRVEEIGWYRASTPSRPGAFWVMPPRGWANEGLRLEHWSLQGERLSTLERLVGWMPTSNYGPSSDGSEPLLPDFSRISMDSRGLLWTSVVVRRTSWREVSSADERQTDWSTLYEGRTEVIDPESGLVVASFGLSPSSSDAPPFQYLIPGSTVGYRTMYDSQGLMSIELFDLHLVSKDRIEESD